MSLQELLRHPGAGDHIVQTYQDPAVLAESVAEYLAAGLAAGEAAIVIARPQHRREFIDALASHGIDAQRCIEHGQLRLLDAEETLALFMADGMPQWKPFRQTVGGLVAEARLSYRGVRAYGEMVDILWQEGQRDAAIQLEEFWNDLAKLQTFSLFCAYFMDNLDDRAYGGALECVCKVHSHLIPARDYQHFDDTVARAAEKVLDRSMMRMLLSMSSIERPPTHMPLGQAMLFWMQKNMPATAKKVLAELRAQS